MDYWIPHNSGSLETGGNNFNVNVSQTLIHTGMAYTDDHTISKLGSEGLLNDR